MSFDDIQLELGVATVCGSCETCARAVVAQCSIAHPLAALTPFDLQRPRTAAGSSESAFA